MSKQPTDSGSIGGDRLARIALCSASLVWCCWMPPTAGAQESYQPIHKISAEVYAHQQMKAEAVSSGDEKELAALTSIGVRVENPSSEEVAIYVVQRLNPQEVTALRTEGIGVRAGEWVPAVAGKHAFGFHIATVDYADLLILAQDPRVVRVESLEHASYPQNDLMRATINADNVLNGNGVPPLDGTGIKIAVADSGLDTGHADFPVPIEQFDMFSGDCAPGFCGQNQTAWSTNVANTVMDHGTHVTGTVLGRGTLSNGVYMGAAPGADLYFYKIGNNQNASASDTDIIEAVNRAGAVGCDIFNLSYGGVHTFMDGSSAVCQAIDAGVAGGMTCFVAAGNDGNANPVIQQQAGGYNHVSLSVTGGAAPQSFTFRIDNTCAACTSADTVTKYFRVIWRDGVADGNIALACTTLNTGLGEQLNLLTQVPPPGDPSSPDYCGQPLCFSARGTESRLYELRPNVPAGQLKNYTLTLQNSTVGTMPLVHVYHRPAAFGVNTLNAYFPIASASYTLYHPADADSAIAVGAVTQRQCWNDSSGNPWCYTWLPTPGNPAPFSSLGPRVDGVLKPDLVAPGAVTISCKDSGTFPPPAVFPLSWATIDNDGVYNAGPDDYYISYGTSMACPAAAGAAALLLEFAPSMTPAQVKTALTTTASNSGSPDNAIGSGLIDILAAIQSVDCNGNGVYDPVDAAGADCNGSGVPDVCDTFPNPPTFAGIAETSGPGTTIDLAVADLDGDGDLDVAGGHSGHYGALWRQFNDGTGNFAPSQQLNLTINAEYLAAGDLDGDGDQDLAISERAYDRVTILLNDGTGFFAAGATYTSITSPKRLTAADFDLDGDLDLVVASTQLLVLMNNGDGSFATPVGYTLLGSRSIAAGDLDGDGFLDLAVARTAFNGGFMAVLINNRDGTFSTPISYTVTGDAYNVAIADLDADGDIDVAASALTPPPPASYWNFHAAVFLNNGDGTFASAVNYASGVSIYNQIGGTVLYDVPLVAGDLDGDGRNDLAIGAASNFSGGGLRLLSNNGDGTFVTPAVMPTITGGSGAVPSHLVIAQWDADSDLDMTAGGIFGIDTVLLNSTVPPVGRDCNGNDLPDDCDLAAATSQDCQVDGIPDECQLAGNDCNANGVPNECDISMGGAQDNDANGVLDQCQCPVQSGAPDCNGNAVGDSCDIAAGAINFGLEINSDLGTELLGRMAAGDFDADGDLDVAYGYGEFGGIIRILLNNGDATFASPTIEGAEFGTLDRAQDLDSDGDADLILETYGVVIGLSDGDGTFTYSYFPPLFAGVVDLDVADLDRDGALDLAVIETDPNKGYSAVSALFGNGDGTFGPAVYLTKGLDLRGVVAADFDNDGHLDLAVATPDSVGVLTNMGDGTFGGAGEYSVSGSPQRVAAGDLDADGDLDLAVTNGTDVLILLNAGDGTFGAPVDLADLAGSFEISTADFTGDGIVDIAVGRSAFDQNEVESREYFIFVGNGDSTFQAPVAVTQPEVLYPGSAAFGDFDVDGDPDWAVHNGSDVSVLPNVTIAPVSSDCNANGTPDDCDIAGATSQDCQSDGIPDDCQLAGNDCNANSSPDQCDISGGSSSDSNSNGLPDECEALPCTGDLNGDGTVNAADLALLLGAWGSNPGHIADISGDGTVNAADLALLLGNWGACP